MLCRRVPLGLAPISFLSLLLLLLNIRISGSCPLILSSCPYFIFNKYSYRNRIMSLCMMLGRLLLLLLAPPLDTLIHLYAPVEILIILKLNVPHHFKSTMFKCHITWKGFEGSMHLNWSIAKFFLSLLIALNIQPVKKHLPMEGR